MVEIRYRIQPIVASNGRFMASMELPTGITESTARQVMADLGRYGAGRVSFRLESRTLHAPKDVWVIMGEPDPMALPESHTPQSTVNLFIDAQ